MFRHTFACNVVENNITTINIMMSIDHADMRTI